MKDSDFELVMKRILAIDDRLTVEALMFASKPLKSDGENLVKTLERITRPDMEDYFLPMLIDVMRLHQKIPTQAEDALIHLQRAIVEINVLPLPSVPLLEICKMPKDEGGVYFILSSRDEVLYVGSSIRLGNRLTAKNHAAIKLIHAESQKTCTVAWHLYPHQNLCKIESHFIRTLEPILNTFGISGTRHKNKTAVSA